LAPNAFTIELPLDIHRQLTANTACVAPHLANQVRRHAAEQGYTFAGPVAVDVCPASVCATVRFRIRIQIVPAGSARNSGHAGGQ